MPETFNINQQSAFSTVIVEDNPCARQNLCFLVDQHPDLNLKGAFEKASDAFMALEENPVDILLLDVELPDMSGIDLLKKLRHRPSVIFATVDRQYAVDAFDAEAVDFLLKPIQQERFLQAIQKVLNQKQVLQRNGKTQDDGLLLRDGRNTIHVRAGDILRVEAMGDYVKIYAKGSVHIIHATMKYIEDKLKPYGLERVHRSHIVRVEAIEKLLSCSMLIGGAEVPVSDTYRQQVEVRMQKAAFKI
jgi:DNA-binding LytR/AlgR family response regulator